MFNKLLNISTNKWYWLGLLVMAVSLELSALFYQYVLDYPPCVLCIHVRIWVLGIIVVSLIAIQLYKNRFFLMIFQLLMTVLSAGLFERAYQTLGIERGFVFGDCNMESGLPAWFALDKWIPTVFEVKAACGYTPEILFGITMAEVLILLSVFLLLISVILLLVQIKKFYFSTDI